ncbi:hypothetical protein BDR03DRAFT_1034517, partial [Suillus americanus]
ISRTELIKVKYSLSLHWLPWSLASALHCEAFTFIATSPTSTGRPLKATVSDFVYIKAAEGTSYISSSFSNQYIGATNAGLICGSYHFALPDLSSGATQDNYFLAHGGMLFADGITLPGALDIEYTPAAVNAMAILSSMVSWIKSFSHTWTVRDLQHDK